MHVCWDYPYQASLDYQAEVPWGDRLRRSGARDREQITLGHVLRDLAAGSGVSALRLPFGNDILVVHPPTLREACFQASAEADLALPKTLRFTVRPKGAADLSTGPAMVIVRDDREEDHLDCYEVPGPFLWNGEGASGEVRFTPEHLACLSQIGMDGEPCYYNGRGTRAAIPMEVMPLVEANPKLLPRLRFWLGLAHAQEAGVHLHSYRLPSELDWLLEGVEDAADALAAIGKPVAEGLRVWVRMRLFRAVAFECADACG